MKVLAAYLLVVLRGNNIPSSEDIKSILSSVRADADADDDKIDFLLIRMDGKDIIEVIASGREKFTAVPSGGGVVIAVSGGGAGGGAPAAPADLEAKKEGKPEEKEESNEDMGFSLFN